MDANPFISKIRLDYFRNHSHLVLDCVNGYNIIYGENGLGKTNILEAISFLGSNKGMRSVSLKETLNLESRNLWQLTFYLENSFLVREIKINVKVSEGGRCIKQISLDGKSGKISDIGASVGVSWLTPQMDRLLTAEPGRLRNYLDRACFDLDLEHLNRLNEYERLNKERQIILTQNNNKWLDVVEERLASLGTTIMLTRSETLAYLNRLLQERQTAFPSSHISVHGRVEEMVQESDSALQIEEKYREQLRLFRSIDQQNKQNNFGIHRSSFEVFYVDKDKNARICSTGEQKALLIGIEIAKAKMRQQARKNYPILLLDEVMSHLDENRRRAFVEEIDNIGSQCFLTGTERGVFEGLLLKSNTMPAPTHFIDLGSCL